MIKKQSLISLGSLTIGFLLILFFTGMSNFRNQPELGLAVEFNTHAAPAYIALESNWYFDEEIKLNSFNSYVTGVSLASALSRGDVQVAYICVGPAIIAKTRGVPIKIVYQVRSPIFIVVLPFVQQPEMVDPFAFHRLVQP